MCLGVVNSGWRTFTFVAKATDEEGSSDVNITIDFHFQSVYILLGISGRVSLQC